MPKPPMGKCKIKPYGKAEKINENEKYHLFYRINGKLGLQKDEGVVWEAALIL